MGRARKKYFGYRQFNRDLRVAYVRRLESVFGKIKFSEETKKNLAKYEKDFENKPLDKFTSLEGVKKELKINV